MTQYNDLAGIDFALCGKWYSVIVKLKGKEQVVYCQSSFGSYIIDNFPKASVSGRKTYYSRWSQYNNFNRIRTNTNYVIYPPGYVLSEEQRLSEKPKYISLKDFERLQKNGKLTPLTAAEKRKRKQLQEKFLKEEEERIRKEEEILERKRKREMVLEKLALAEEEWNNSLATARMSCNFIDEISEETEEDEIFYIKIK